VITGIVVALPEELSTLTSTKLTKGSSRFINNNVLVIYSGTGPINASSAAEHLISQGATKLISWGCAAALSETLKPGDLILVNELIATEENKATPLSVNAHWHQHTSELLATFVKVNCGGLAESKSIVSSSEHKKKIHTNTNAVALDMESIAIAKVANQHSLPFLAIRVIADPVEMSLPLAITHSINQHGDVVLSKLLAYLAWHPRELLGLIRLGLYFRSATKTLKLIARHLGPITLFQKEQ
jgi:adenosylhomocysteine nucleosidase